MTVAAKTRKPTAKSRLEEPSKSITRGKVNGREKDLLIRLAARGDAKAKSLLRRLKTLSVIYLQDGNFTTVLLKDGANVWVGTSKRNPMDASNNLTGEAVALTRAVRNGSIKY